MTDDEAFPLWEVIQTAHVAARRFTEVFAAAGLTPTQFGVLAALADDADLSQADLARIVLVRPQSMGELIGSLLTRDLVRRDGAGGRGRRARLHLTDAGYAALVRALPAARRINTPASLGLDPRAAADVVRHLRIIRAALDAADDEPRPT
jgi:DNA-binding MarR family transcriptional regulator